MANYLKNLTMQVETISPLHVDVGTDDQISSKWLVWENQRVIVLDEERLLAEVVTRDIVTQFEAFCLDSRKKIQGFLQHHGIRLPDVTAYSLSCPKEPKQTLLPFIKSKGQPYLPGSSLKGAVRSSLLRAFLLENDNEVLKEAAKQLEEVVKYRGGSPAQRLEALLYTGTKDGKHVLASQTSNYDLLRSMGIRDSEALELPDLQVLPVQVISTISTQRGRTMRPKPFTIYPELLRPNLVFQMRGWLDFTIFEQDRLGLNDHKSWIEEFVQRGQAASRQILRQEQTFYGGNDRQSLADWCRARLTELDQCAANECLLSVGWGTGFDAKTVTDLFHRDLFRDTLQAYKNTKRLGRPRNNSNIWLGPDGAPKTRRITTWNGQEMPLGWVKLTVQDEQG